MPWESKHLSEFILIFIYTSCYLKAPAKLNLTYRFFCEIIMSEQIVQIVKVLEQKLAKLLRSTKQRLCTLHYNMNEIARSLASVQIKKDETRANY